MSNDEQARILNRVRKMMNLANDSGATEGERDNALRMAHATLAKYNLDIAQVEANTAQGEKEAAGEPRDAKEKIFYGTTYARSIAQAVAQLFFCHYFYSKLGPNTNNVRHTFVGRTSNVITAQEMSEYLVNAVHREATKYARLVGGGCPCYRAFAQAATSHIYDRCYKLRQDSERQTSDIAAKVPGTALVLSSLYEKEQSMNLVYIEQQLGVKLRTGKGRERYANDYGARAAGAAYGKGVSLNRQLQ